MAQTLSSLPIGTAIKFGKHQVNTETAQPIIWVIADKNHYGYPANSVTLIAQKIIDLRAYDNRETVKTNGNNNYALSNIHQWLNSNASAGKWYSATHADDAPPTGTAVNMYKTEYQARAGFLYNFTESERAAMIPTTFVNQVGTDISSKITARVFLPSVWEINGYGDVFEGSSFLAYFQSNTGSCVLTQQAYTNTLCSSKPDEDNDYCEYYTRNTIDDKVAVISMSGGNSESAACYGNRGIRPIINLSATAKISDTTDGDGCYTWIENKSPAISGSNSDLGTKSAEFSTSYTITQGDGDAVTVTEYIDNVAVRSYVATLNSTNNFVVNGMTWLKLTNGAHTLKVVATDGFNTDTRVYTFLKVVNKIVVQRKTPIPSATQPTRIIVSIVKNIPTTATLKVEVCNDGFDTNPTWETIAPNVVHEFSNTQKEANKDWGVNIRVTVNRNGAEGACYITEIGGNFE